MKLNYIIMALAACIAFISCSKYAIDDSADDKMVQIKDRIIAVAFDSDTKTTLDGLQPHFSEGDLIKLSNTVSSQVCTVKIANSKASISTTLSGTLTAVYPSSAARMKGEEIDGILVPARQSGRFADANICQATISEGCTSANFQNKVAILKFYVDESIGVKSIKVESASSITSDGKKAITVAPDGNNTINTVTDDPEARLCYIATIGGIHADNLKFTSETTTQGTVVRELNTVVTLVPGTIYRAFIPYYIKIKVNNNPVMYQKWGYCNVGGFLPEDYGDYYGWGAVETIYGKEYDWVNAPFQTVNTVSWRATRWTKYLGSITSQYKDASANDADAMKTVLDMEDDIANYKWGGEWRMPTIQDYEAFQARCNRVWDSFNGVEGYKISSRYGDGSPLFFPAAGYHDVDYDGDGSSLWAAGSDGAYWLSSLCTAEPHSAYYFYFYDGTFASDIFPRYGGQSVRPVMD